jgi:hypothetical protein
MTTRGDDLYVGTRYLFDFDHMTEYLLRWNGAEWSSFGAGALNDFSDGMITTMLFSGDDLYIGGDFSLAGGISSYQFAIWHSSLPAAVEEKPVVDRAEENSIIVANHPNPCFGRTTITFTLPRSGDATLTIFNGHGQEVEQLASGRFEEGTHTVEWEPRDLPAGVYLCRVKSGGAARSATMILLGE